MIPVKAREQLDLKEGMELSVEVKEGALVLRKAKPTSWKKWQGALKDSSALRILEGEHREEIRKGR